LKFPKLGLLWFWRPITLCADLQLRWILKQSYSLYQEISNGMWHATWTQVNQGDYRLLVVKSQIGNLIPDPSFSNNLCFKCSNGSCEPILDIYVLQALQWYMELFNPMNFDPCNRPLKIWESIETPTPKTGTHLGVWGFIPSHFPTLLGTWNVTFRLHSWPAPLQALSLVTSPRLGLQHYNKSMLNSTSSIRRPMMIWLVSKLIWSGWRSIMPKWKNPIWNNRVS
jgi:hypothetical protein